MPPSRACTAWVISLVAGRPRAPRRARRAVPNASEAARRRGQDAAMARCQETRCEGRGRGYGGAEEADVTTIMVVFVLGPRSGCTYAPSGRTYQKTKTPDACFWTCPTSVVVLLREKFSNKLIFARKKEIFFFSGSLRIRRFRGPSIFVWPAFRVSVEIKSHSDL